MIIKLAVCSVHANLSDMFVSLSPIYTPEQNITTVTCICSYMYTKTVGNCDYQPVVGLACQIHAMAPHISHIHEILHVSRL